MVSYSPPSMSEREKAHLLQEYDSTEDDTMDINRYITQCVQCLVTLLYLLQWYYM